MLKSEGAESADAAPLGARALLPALPPPPPSLEPPPPPLPRARICERSASTERIPAALRPCDDGRAVAGAEAEAEAGWTEAAGADAAESGGAGAAVEGGGALTPWSAANARRTSFEDSDVPSRAFISAATRAKSYWCLRTSEVMSITARAPAPPPRTGKEEETANGRTAPEDQRISSRLSSCHVFCGWFPSVGFSGRRQI